MLCQLTKLEKQRDVGVGSVSWSVTFLNGSGSADPYHWLTESGTGFFRQRLTVKLSWEKEEITKYKQNRWIPYGLFVMLIRGHIITNWQEKDKTHLDEAGAWCLTAYIYPWFIISMPWKNLSSLYFASPLCTVPCSNLIQLYLYLQQMPGSACVVIKVIFLSYLAFIKLPTRG